MSQSEALILHGAPGSPYTRKMLAILRYRHIPYRFNTADQVQKRNLPQPKVALLPTFYFPDDQGGLVPTVDSTPIIRRLETEYQGRSVLPADPVIAFLDYLLEDYGDEWLTKAMFHYRWHYDADIRKGGLILPRWAGLTKPEAELVEMGRYFANRQTSRLYVVGSNDTTAPVIEDSYKRFLKLFDAHMDDGPQFLLGSRPGAGDFAAFGQLTQLVNFDPTPSQVTLDTAPRILAWTEVCEDLSGMEPAEDDWIHRYTVPDTLKAILAEVGKVYVPAMMANARALINGAETVETEIDGRPWTQKPFPYQGKCLQWIREEYNKLNDTDQKAVDALLDGTGVEPLIKETL